MRFAATLDAMPLPALPHLISAQKKSRKLTLRRSDGHPLIAVRARTGIEAASEAVRESFGAIVRGRGLISEADLNAALQRQYSFHEERRLGSILVEMGKVSRDDVRDAMKQQAEKVVTEVFQWTTGYFKFE